MFLRCKSVNLHEIAQTYCSCCQVEGDDVNTLCTYTLSLNKESLIAYRITYPVVLLLLAIDSPKLSNRKIIEVKRIANQFQMMHISSVMMMQGKSSCSLLHDTTCATDYSMAQASAC